MGKIATESEEQIALMTWCKRNEEKYPGLDMIFHIPNGGVRNIRTASRLKLEGVKPGIPDLFLPVPNEKYNGLFIEMKRRKGGRLSDNQRKWIERLKKQKFEAVKVNGSSEAIKIIKSYFEMT